MTTTRPQRRRLTVALGVGVVAAVALGTFAVRSGDHGDRGATGSSATSTSGAPTSSTTSTAIASTTTTVVPPAASSEVSTEVVATVADEGRARVIVEVPVDPAASEAERAAQADARIAEVRATLPEGSFESVATSDGAPYFAVTVDAAGLDAITASGEVRSVSLSHRLEPAEMTTPSSGTLVPESENATVVDGATTAWGAGARGAGAVVAVIDTGVDVAHPYLNATPKTFWEACFVTAWGSFASPCPNPEMGVMSAPVPGSAAPCPLAACAHGTHVAGIATGGNGTGTVSGMAPAAGLVAIQVFAYNSSTGKVTADEFDVYKALLWLHNLRASFPGLAAVNLSLGDGVARAGYCDTSLYKPAIDQLLLDGVATVVAAGNEGSTNGVSAPGCISTAVTTGAVDDTNPTVSTSYSNDGMQLDLMAPGSSICSSVPGGGGSGCSAPFGGRMDYKTGTSMATPAVTGAYAQLAGEGVPVAQRLARLRRVVSGGTTVKASWWNVPLLRVDVALGLTDAASLVGVTPSRIMDTRIYGGALGGGETRDLKVTGVGGVPVAGAVAVALNVTAVDPTASGYLSVYPAGRPQPTSSNLNFVPGGTVPNMVMVAVGAGGKASIFNFAGSTEVVVDVVGWITDVASYGAIDPQRFLDTRSGAAYTTIDGAYRGTGPIVADTSLHLDVLGRGSVPASGVGSVVLNVTAVDSTAGGYLTVFPTGSARPTASNLNFVPGSVTPNLVLAKVGAGGMVDIFNFTGSTQVVVDVLGWFPPPGDTLHSIVPTRFMDTRSGPGISTFDGQSLGQGAIGAGQVRLVQITGRGGIVPSTVSAVALNVTVTGPTAEGYLTVYPSGVGRPTASNLNFRAGATIANSVVARVGADGRVAIYNFAGSSDVVVDVVGWFP